MQDTLLSLQHITKNFGEGDVLRDISLDVARGEFVTLLGASGCGKTTTLRIISGLETPDEGTVLLDGKDVTALPPERRPVNTVFQSYALFPHMNVEKNVAYGLRVHGMDKASIAKRVREMLELVQMEDYAKRMPSQLSGGQRQRIAIARALAPEPELLLLDEPLGALDLQLRRQMQLELKRLQKKLGITFVYITHDQEEAINMSDRSPFSVAAALSRSARRKKSTTSRRRTTSRSSSAAPRFWMARWNPSAETRRSSAARAAASGWTLPARF